MVPWPTKAIVSDKVIVNQSQVQASKSCWYHFLMCTFHMLMLEQTFE